MIKKLSIILLLFLSDCAEAHQRAVQENFQKDEALCHSAGFTTILAKTQCDNEALVKRAQANGYPYMDLVSLQMAYRIKIAKEVDDKKISLEDAKFAVAQYDAQLTDQEHQRNAQQAQSNANAVMAYSALQASMPHPAPAQLYIPPAPVNTNCNMLGNTMNCTSR